MKIFFVICTFFTAIAFNDSASITPPKYESGQKCKTVEIETEYYNPDGDETRIQKSNEEASCQGNDRSEGTEGIEATPPLASPQRPELEILENINMTPNYFYALQPTQRILDWTTPWQRTGYNNLPGFGGIPYSGHYFVQPSMYTPYNPSPAYLPPAIPTYARRPIPELHRQMYQRPARVIRSREEDDFLAELRHMAMMNNILPTMPIPFMRSSYNDYAPYSAPNAGGALAVYPASASGCAVPLLFSCSPKITRGIDARPLPQDSQLVPSAALAYEYQKQEWNKEDTAELKSDVSQSDIISNVGLELGGDKQKEPAMNAIDRALQPKHVVDEKHTVPVKSQGEGVHPAHMTS